MKKNMSLIDQLLERTNSPIQIDTQKVSNAKTKLEKKFFEGVKINAILCVIFLIIWFNSGNDTNITFPYRIVVSIITFVGSLWYLYLYQMVKKIDIYNLTPKALFAKISNLKLTLFSGQVAITVIIVVIFTIFLPQICTKSLLGFYFCIATIIAAIAISIFVYIPRYKKIFKDLIAIKD